MKIFELAPYAYFDGHTEFNKTSGAAFAISDICEALAKSNDVFLLTQSAITNGFSFKGINVCRRTWIDIILNMKLQSFGDGFKAISGLDAPFIYKLKVLLYFLSQGYTEKLLRKVTPDIVHIESIGFYTLPFMMASVNCGIPFVATNHGLISFAGKERVDSKQKLMESEFFKLAEQFDIPITCVSTGSIRRLKEAFGISGENVCKVGNCIGEFALSENTDQLRNELGISESDYVVICVGSITENKNQIQVARAYKLLPANIRARTVLLFIGDGPKFKELQAFVVDQCPKEKIKCIGFVEHKQLSAYYAISDINITASKDEGFGLPIIEAFQYGIPTVTFSDLDAVPDLFFKEGMYLASKRTDSALAKALEDALYKAKDDKNIIMEHSKFFTKEHMAKEYMNVFASAMDKNYKIKSSHLRGLL